MSTNGGQDGCGLVGVGSLWGPKLVQIYSFLGYYYKFSPSLERAGEESWKEVEGEGQGKRSFAGAT